mmetsp:Transcript_64960/g.141562  ORF Transcript_64960/g.141562 Transcript_64960/m.141562 type:complete len:695 (+) Transcript_64960:1-2085(+)
MIFKEFLMRYGIIASKVQDTRERDRCENILKAVGITDVGVQVGKTRVFYRARHHMALEILYLNKATRAAAKFQSAHRGLLARKLKVVLLGHRKNLNAAMKTRTQPALEKAIEEAENVEWEIREVGLAKRLLRVVIEERTIFPKLEDLLKRDISQVLSEMDSVVSHADDIGVSGPVVDKARVAVTNAKEAIRAREDLETAAKEHDDDLLKDALSRAATYNVTGTALTKGKELMTRFEKQYTLTDKVNAALGEGQFKGTGPAAAAAVSFTALEEAVGAALSFGVQGAKHLDFMSLATAILTMRKSIAADDWQDGVHDAVLQAERDGLDSAELKEIRKEVAKKGDQSKTRAALDAATSARDEAALVVGLEEAAALGMLDEDYFDVGEIVYFAKETYENVKDIREALEIGMENVDEATIEAWLNYATDQHYASATTEKATQLLDKIKAAEAACVESVRLVEKVELERALALSTEINLTTERVSAVTALLALDHTKFLQAQLRAAKSLGDEERVLRVTLSLKDDFFRDHGKMFNFAACPSLRTPQDYAQHYRIRIWNREKARLEMLHWQKNSLPTSLTKIVDSATAKQAKRLFQNVLGYMGDKELMYPDQLLEEIKTQGTDVREIRDEMYCQVIKQLSDNPSPESISRGWRLLREIVTAWPPSQELSNYVEIFIRNREDNPDKDHDIEALHRRVFTAYS